jgi:hypothetical protein
LITGNALSKQENDLLTKHASITIQRMVGKSDSKAKLKTIFDIESDMKEIEELNSLKISRISPIPSYFN